MKLKKAVTIAAAAGALAAISVPAMALENEFHGLYNFNTTFSNFQAGGTGDYTPAGKPEKQKMNNYFEQRVRLLYQAKVSDDLKLVTQFEIDHRFGDGNADLDTDSMNLEVKHAYLDFNLGKTNVKLGLQPYKDTIKGLFIDADVPMIMTSSKFGAYTLGLGFARYDDDVTGGRLGDNNADLFIMDNTFAFSKDTKAALSYYFLADYAGGSVGGGSVGPVSANAANDAILVHTLGLSGETKLGAATLSGFAAMQAGHAKNVGMNGGSAYVHGWAANVAAKVPAGPGTAKAAFLFTSGDNSSNNSSSYKAWLTSGVNTYNEGGMAILARNTLNSPTTTDHYIRRNVTNIALATLGYDANLTDKFFLNTNAGAAWVPASGETNNGADFMGAEVNLEPGYKVNANLTLKATMAYMFLGGMYKDTAAGGTDDPANPYSLRLHAQFKF